IPNTSANTYAQLQARVAAEVLGFAASSDANNGTSYIVNAIQDAISEFERETFWFNDMRTFGGSVGSQSDLQTVLGQEFYSYADLPVLVNMPHIRKVMVLAFANRYPLVERTQQWIDDVSISTTWQGLPTDYCIQAGALRLYPVPNGGYPLIIDGTIRFPPLVNQSDYNVWTNRGEWLIRTEAKRLLFTNVNRDADQAAAMERELMGEPATGRQGALAQLRRESMRRAGGTGRIRPSRGYM
ncbi:MAG: hypothetical protein KGL39_26285, partial [Patescibacteria group bacterium]|nr:hypothetical protein [Patescibacteria group bacterium]